MKNNLPQGVVCPCPGVIYMYIANIFKALLLKNPMTNQSQISCEASMGIGKESLYKWPRSQDQDGRHANIHIW